MKGERRQHVFTSSFILPPSSLLMEQRGIEPLTSALRTRRSAKLSYCPEGLKSGMPPEGLEPSTR